MSRPIVLLTATVTPPAGAPGLARTDVSQRWNDYRTALTFYARHFRGAFDLVFADNSDTDLRQLAPLDSSVASVFEWLRWDGSQASALGRGYGELVLIERAMAESTVIAEADDDTWIWKVTGRYQVRNVRRLVESAPRNAGLYVNLRRIPMPWLDAHVIAFRKGAYSAYLQPLHRVYHDAISHSSVEEVLYPWAAALPRDVCVPRFAIEPRVVGIRGWDGRRYDDWLGTSKWLARTAAKRLLPSVWI